MAVHVYTYVLICFHSVPAQPQGVMVERVDDTSMLVSWDKLTLVELKGLANYTITYSISTESRRKRQAEEGRVMVPWTESSVTIHNLRPNAAYDVNVGTVTSVGPSSKCLSFPFAVVIAER